MIDEKEHERLKEQLRLLVHDGRDMVATAYFEEDETACHTRVVVDEQRFCEFMNTMNEILRARGDSETGTLSVKMLPTLDMRDALEWLLRPDHAIGSDPELIRKAREKAAAALGESI